MNAKADHRVVDMQGTGFVWEDDHRSSDDLILALLADGHPRSIRQIEAAAKISYNAAKGALVKLQNMGAIESKMSRTANTGDGGGNRMVKIYRRKLQ